MAIPPDVIAGEVIEVEWGNSVRDWAAEGEVYGSGTFTYTTTASIADAGSVSVTIPTDWLGWSATVWAFWTITTASSTSYEFRVRIDGTDQTLITGVTTGAAGVTSLQYGLARRTGMTTTGSRAFALRARHLAAVSVGMGNGLIVVNAVRTS